MNPQTVEKSRVSAVDTTQPLKFQWVQKTAKSAQKVGKSVGKK